MMATTTLVDLTYFRDIVRECSKKEKDKSKERLITIKELDIAQILPPEICGRIFDFLPAQDIFSASKCSNTWRDLINDNHRWYGRCKKCGWADSKTSDELWTGTPTHISFDQLFESMTKVTPNFRLSTLPSDTFEPLCNWGKFFRQRLWLENNWRQGRYVIHALEIPYDSDFYVCTTASSNDRIFVSGSIFGFILIWSIVGIPKFLTTIKPFERAVEVVFVKIIGNRLMVLYQVGLLRIYDVERMSKAGDYDPGKDLKILSEHWVWGHKIRDHEFTLKTHQLTLMERQEFEITIDNLQRHQRNPPEFFGIGGGGDDMNDWVRRRFRSAPWLDTEYIPSDMIISATENLLIVAGVGVNNFLLWTMKTGLFLREVTLAQGSQIYHKVLSTSVSLYISARKFIPANNQHTELEDCFIFVYNYEKEKFIDELPLRMNAEDIRVDEKDEKLVYLTQNSDLVGYDLVQKQEVFFREGTSFVDQIIVHDKSIIFHQYNGKIICLNWSGETMFEAEAHVGFVRGIRVQGNCLVTGGDFCQIHVWDIKTGEKLYTIHENPFHVGNIFVGESKIVTVSRIDNPCLIGFW